MTGIEPVLIKIGQVVIAPAVKAWLGGRERRDERDRPLSGLLDRRIEDGMLRRRLDREIEAMADAVTDRLTPLANASRLPPNERRAALAAVVDAFTKAAADDEAVFAADADPARLAALIRSRVDLPERAALTPAGERLFDAVLGECCEAYLKTVVHLRSFAPRATVEILGRLSGQADQLAQVLARLPVRDVDEPTGPAADEAFSRRYLSHVSDRLDEVELFGVDVRNYRPVTTLSVAYVSLAVAANGRSASTGGRVRAPWSPGMFRAGDRRPGVPGDAASSVRVEHALSRRGRTLMLGEAGSGKTTVLRWLAITAARGGFSGELAEWNGWVPFLVRLRQFVGRSLPTPAELITATAETVAERAPEGWADRRLAAGRALLLVDGVDELPAGQRRAVQRWLRDLLLEYPDIAVVVTSRPAAATGRWLAKDGFAPATLERMTPSDVRSLIAHWHRAVADGGDLPCDPAELPRFENTLVARIDANPHLQALATSPLLCAMLCALNLDRRTYLPRDRMSVYAAAVDLLLERRDIERDITSALTVTGRDKLRLIQYLAWRMSINNESETTVERAVARIADQRAAMPQVTDEAPALFEHLLHRSGLIRQPAAGRVDFVHRTFQEYLTAREAADRADVGMLVEKAHLDTWRETVVMAAGHANAVTRHELIGSILDRADAEPGHRRHLRLLAASCLETVDALDPRVLRRVHDAIDALVPPRATREARSLAAVGEPLLRRLPVTIDALSPAAAVATVRTVALVNGPEALDLLARYASDPRPEVRRELVVAWDYFDPEEYATRILSGLEFGDAPVTIANPLLLPATRLLRPGTTVEVTLVEPADPAQLADVPGLSALYAHQGVTGSLAPLRRRETLQTLTMFGHVDPRVPAGLEKLEQLTLLWLYFYPITELRFLGRLRALETLYLGDLYQVVDYAPLRDLKRLQTLRLVEPQATGQPWFGVLPELRSLTVWSGGEPAAGLAGVVASAPGLGSLGLDHCDWLTDLGPLSSLEKLTHLSLDGAPVADLAPLAALPGLEDLSMIGCSNVTDLRPLAGAPGLTDLWIGGVAPGVDLSPFAGREMLTIHLAPDQVVVGAETLGPGVRVK